MQFIDYSALSIFHSFFYYYYSKLSLYFIKTKSVSLYDVTVIPANKGRAYIEII